MDGLMHTFDIALESVPIEDPDGVDSNSKAPVMHRGVPDAAMASERTY